ncbi:MAG: class I SAM-dependent DNA methyltransferase [Acutalibacteraceae bacterium]
MSEYDNFAPVYDRLMSDVDYKARTDRLLELFCEYDRTPALMLDLACGTGGFSNEFAARGIEVIGVDMSEEMLSAARESSAERGTDVLYLCQRAEELDLYGTVDGAVCCLDSLNHITDYDGLCKAIGRVSLFLEAGRLFIFDVNTVFKHKFILADNTFIIEQDGVFCAWQNSTDEETNITDISLDFFVEEGNYYKRSSEDFSERAYTEEELASALNAAGLEILKIYDDMTDNPVWEYTERAVYVTRKKEETNNE